jgi:hypothetical protein
MSIINRRGWGEPVVFTSIETPSLRLALLTIVFFFFIDAKRGMSLDHMLAK